MASEIMVTNQGIASCIRSRRLQQLPSLIQIGSNSGMHTIDDSVAHLAIHGFISLDDALLRARDKDFVQASYDRKMRELEARKR